MFALNLNPCIDRTVVIPDLVPGGTNRVTHRKRLASGKAVNVAVALRRLGVVSSSLAGFFWKQGGDELVERLAREGVAHHGVWLEGALRENIKILSQATSQVTELNEAGTPVTPEAMAALYALAEELMAPGDTWALCGSLPPGAATDTYARIIESARAVGCACALDTSGEALRQGLLASPDLVKPNRFELETLCGRALPSLEAVLEAALGLCAGGVGAVLVSLGEEGAVITNGVKVYRAPAAALEQVTSTVGAGDAMLAGALYARCQGLDLRQQLLWGTAAAASAVALGEVSPEAAARYMEAIHGEEVSF